MVREVFKRRDGAHPPCDRQVGDSVGASGFDRAGLMTLLAERVENWLATCSPNGKLLQ